MGSDVLRVYVRVSRRVNGSMGDNEYTWRGRCDRLFFFVFNPQKMYVMIQLYIYVSKIIGVLLQNFIILYSSNVRCVNVGMGGWVRDVCMHA